MNKVRKIIAWIVMVCLVTPMIVSSLSVIPVKVASAKPSRDNAIGAIPTENIPDDIEFCEDLMLCTSYMDTSVLWGGGVRCNGDFDTNHGFSIMALENKGADICSFVVDHLLEFSSIDGTGNVNYTLNLGLTFSLDGANADDNGRGLMIAELNKWFGSTAADRLYIYDYAECDGNDDMEYIGCDYDTVSGKFNYYVLMASRNSGEKDSLYFMVFRSDYLYFVNLNTNTGLGILKPGLVDYTGYLINFNGSRETYDHIRKLAEMNIWAVVESIVSGSESRTGAGSVITEIIEKKTSGLDPGNELDRLDSLVEFRHKSPADLSSILGSIFPVAALIGSLTGSEGDDSNSSEDLYSIGVKFKDVLYIEIETDQGGHDRHDTFTKFGLSEDCGYKVFDKEVCRDLHGSVDHNDGICEVRVDMYIAHEAINLGNPEYIDFGDSTGIVSSGSRTDSFKALTGTQKSIINTCVSILNSVADVGKSKTVEITQEYADLFRSSYNCEFVAELIEKFGRELSESVEKQGIKNVFDTADKDTFKDIPDNASSFEIMNAIIISNVECIADNKQFSGNYKIGSKYVTLDKTGDHSANGASTLKDVWKELNNYQQDILVEAYKGKLAAIEDSCKSSITSSALWIRSLSVHQFEPKTISKVSIEDTQKMIKDYENGLISNTGNLLNVARSCDILCHYVITSALYTNSTDVESIYSVYNPDLVTLAESIWNYPGISNNVFAYFPERMRLFGTDTSDYTALLETDTNWQRFTAMLYNVEYAFRVCAWSERGEEQKYTPQDIEQWFAGGGSGGLFAWLDATKGASAYESSIASLNLGNDEVSINMLRCISQLGRMCEFLDIDIGDWSDTIDCYLRIYRDYKDFFLLLDNSGLIYERAATGQNTIDEPLGMFFNLENNTMTDQWIKGFALSSLYVPMETNIYDASTVTFDSDSDWISGFFYKYAFFRKALYINTDNSAVVNEFTSGKKSGTRVATLSDLLNYDRDIILTIDDNFYNANKIDTVISRLDYTAIRNTADAEDTATGLDAASNYISGMMDLDAGKVLKTGADMYYSDTLAQKVTPLGKEAGLVNSMYDPYLLSAEEILGKTDGEETIESVLDSYEYSVKMSYGVVSAIYRSDKLYNECLRAIVSDNAIFKSSKAICSTPGTSSSDWRSVYNYYMLANLEEQMKNDSASTLDLDAPIFCDIFGNIVTESGLVIIPAAANATICGTYWSPYVVGWSEYYNNGNHIAMSDFNEDVYEWLTGMAFEAVQNTGPVDATDAKEATKKNAGGYFWVSDNELVLRTTDLTSNNLTGTIQFDNLNKNSTVVKQLFFNDAYFSKGKEMYSHRLTNLVVEVLRGAPIEYIDYEYEGLSGNLNISKYGVYMAYKLEELVNTLISGTNGNAVGGNSVITMPNLAFVNGIEYIMLYIFKIVFAVLVVGLGVSLYLDAVRNSLGIKSILKFLGTCMMVLLAFTLMPNLISWTYYDANKNMLSDEAGRIMMLNYVKEYDGAEIGITSVRTPETNTELYLKVSDISVPWWKIIPEVLFGHTFSTVTELYENELKEDPMALNETVQMKGDGLYVDIQDIFDSTALQFTPSTNTLANFMRLNSRSSRQVSYKVVEEQAVEDPVTGEIVMKPVEVVKTHLVDIGKDPTSVVSFTSPYYAILDQLVNNVNEYNVTRDITAYSWSVGSNGNILTYDILTPYLTSPEFLEDGFDILGLETLLGVDGAKLNYNYAFTSTDAEQMKLSLWWPSDVMTSSLKKSKIDEVYKYAREFVISNKDVLGKVPDEVFLKVMAMQIAVKYNKVFGIYMGNSVEIINVDTRDLMRFMVAPNDSIYKHYSYSFSRYVYEESGTIGVVLSGILIVIYWLTSFLKPLAMIVILGLLITNIVLRKVLFRKESKCVEGYLIGCACLCLCNYLYAIMLKVSMSIANIGMGSATALICAVIVQILYVVGLIGIVVIEMKDWRNSGYNEFANIGAMLQSKMLHAKNIVVERMLAKNNEAYGDSSDSRRYTGDDYDSGSVDAMLERDREREERGAYSPN